MTERSPITVVVIDDHKVMVESLRIALAARPDADIEVVGSGHTIDEGVAAVQQFRPDVVLLDYHLGRADARDAIPRILAAAPTRIVMLTAVEPGQVLLDCLRLGVRGFASKEQTVDEVVEVIRTAHGGALAVAPELLTSAMNAPSDPVPDPHAAEFALSVREYDVLALVAAGRSNQEIADTLYLSVNTVRNHVAAILDKLDARSRVEATALFHQGRVPRPKS